MSPYRSARMWALSVIIVAVVVAVTVLGIGWRITDQKVTSNQHKVDKRWCTLLQQINFPRSTDAGRKFNAALTQLEREFGCRG